MNHTARRRPKGMRNLTVNTFVSLDGVMQGPGAPDEDTSGGFTHGGWSFGYWDELMNEHMAAYMGRPFDLVLGRRTYEIFAAHWPHQDNEAAAALNGATKHVASTTLTTSDLTWERSSVIAGDVVAAVGQLKAQDGPELQVHGSANLLQTLLAGGVVDELHAWIFPVVLGGGKRLFAEGLPATGLELLGAKTATSGVVIATYRPGADIRYGSFAG